MRRIDLPTHDIWSTDKIIFHQTGSNVSFITESGDYLERKISNGKFTIQSLKGEIIQQTKESIKILDSTLKVIKEVKLNHFPIQIKDYYSNKILLREIGNKKNGHLVFYDFNTKIKSTIIDTDYNFARFANDRFIILNNHKFIIAINPESKESYWKLDVTNIIESESAQIYSGQVVISGDKIALYIHSKSWDKYVFIILRLSDGVILHSTKRVGPKFQVYNDNIYSINTKKGSIIKLTLGNLNYEENVVFDQLSGLKINTECDPLFFDDELLIAMQKKNEDIYSHWARISLGENKVISIQEELINPTRKRSKANQAFVSSFVRSKTQIGVKISGRTLVIYDKE